MARDLAEGGRPTACTEMPALELRSMLIRILGSRHDAYISKNESPKKTPDELERKPEPATQPPPLPSYAIADATILA